MSDNWSIEELRAAVEAYIDMHAKEADGILFVKKKYYSDLSRRFGRTEKSFEYRMQNISHVFSLMGRDWVSGLKPAKNVGSNKASIIERLILEVEGKELPRVAEFESQVAFCKSKKILGQPQGIKEPEKTYLKVTNYSRDPKVKAWILREAAGICECCDSKAPFITIEGEPFLEVHHLRRLADGGSDVVTNAVALCPNCHRELHYGAAKAALAKSLYRKINRLVRG